MAGRIVNKSITTVGAARLPDELSSATSIDAAMEPRLCGFRGSFPNARDLIPFQFGVFKGGGEADRTSMVIHLLCDLKTVFFRYSKQMFQHVDDVGVSVLLVVPRTT